MTPREHLFLADELQRLLSLAITCPSGDSTVRLYDLADLVLPGMRNRGKTVKSKLGGLGLKE
jgi:hypothetical protein